MNTEGSYYSSFGVIAPDAVYEIELIFARTTGAGAVGMRMR